MIQLDGSGKLVFDRDDLPGMRDSFRRQRVLRLPKLIEPAILNRVLKNIDGAVFLPAAYSHKGVRLGAESRIHPNDESIRIMSMLLNNCEFFKIVEQITGCCKIRSFVGRIRREVPGTDHFLTWHMDPNPKRLMGISVNLSRENYLGGTFQIREKESEQILGEVSNTGQGDAFIFQIGDGCQHRVTSIEGSASRTTCAGWFYSDPDFLTLLLQNPLDQATRDAG